MNNTLHDCVHGLELQQRKNLRNFLIEGYRKNQQRDVKIAEEWEIASLKL